MMIRTKINEYKLQDKTSGIKALMEEIRLEYYSNRLAGFFVRVADGQNHTLSLTVPHRWKNINIKELENKTPVKSDKLIFIKREDDNDILMICSYRLSNGFLLQVGKGSDERERLLKRFRQIFGGIMILLIFLGFMGGIFFAFRALRPVRDLIQTVRRIDKGKMDERVPLSYTGDELDELINLFNGMLEKIETLVMGIRHALDNVAHDLRTPLTRIRAIIETVLRSDSDANTLKEALMDCAEETERIVTMQNALMDISEAETGMIKLHFEKINIAFLIEEMVELYQYVAEDKGITIYNTVKEEFYVLLDVNRMRQVIANLLDNAVKYTSSGGQICIEAYPKKNNVAILVKDTGEGIPSHELSQIFDRLYRGDKSRSHRGLGLGLSIVQAVINAHKGRIEVESELGRGSRFTIVLPLDPYSP